MGHRGWSVGSVAAAVAEGDEGGARPVLCAGWHARRAPASLAALVLLLHEFGCAWLLMPPWRPAAATKHAANGEASTHGADIGGACRGAHRRLSHSPVCVHMGARGVTWEAAAVRAAEARAAAAAGRVQ